MASGSGNTAGGCQHIWRFMRKYRDMDGWGYWHDHIEWYCEKCRKTESRAA